MIRSKKALEVQLSRLRGFPSAKVRDEQHSTPGSIAAEVLWHLCMRGEIGDVSVDLGCGTGILGIGLLLLGSKRVIFVDKDADALAVLEENLTTVASVGDTEIVCADVATLGPLSADLVVTNPPFGTKQAGADVAFVEKAAAIAPLVYSFHKTSTREHLLLVGKALGLAVTEAFSFPAFPLPMSMTHHRKRIGTVAVSCLRWERPLDEKRRGNGNRMEMGNRVDP